MDQWINTYHRLWEVVGDKAKPRNNVDLVGVSITKEGAEATLVGPLPCPVLTEFQDGNSWVVTRNEQSVKYREDDIILQLNGCAVMETHFGQMTTMSPSNAQVASVLVKVRCGRVWIK